MNTFISLTSVTGKKAYIRVSVIDSIIEIDGNHSQIGIRGGGHLNVVETTEEVKDIILRICGGAEKYE